MPDWWVGKEKGVDMTLFPLVSSRRGKRSHVRWSILVAAISALLLASCGGGASSTAQATPQARQSLKLVTGAVATSHAIAWIALEGGYFARNGLDVSLQSVGANVVTSLVSGQADIGLSAWGVPMTPARDGNETSLIYADVDALAGAFAVGLPKVQSIKDCTRMSAFPPGFSPYAYAVIEKRLYGAHYDIVPMDVPTQQAALASGTVDCGINGLGTFVGLLDAGKVHLLVDPRDKSSLPKDFPTTGTSGGLWGMKSNLQSKRDAIVRLLRALDQAWVAMQKMSPEEAAALLRKSADWQPIAAAQLAKQYELDRPFFQPANGYLSSTAWQPSRQLLIDGGFTFMNTTDQKWSYERRVDMSYYETAIGKPKA